MLVQFDGFSGFTSVVPVGTDKFPLDFKISTTLDKYPANSADYRIVLAGIPNEIYEKPFIGAVKTPLETYNTTKPFDGIFSLAFEKLYHLHASYGTEISVFLTPVLSVATENAYTFRVKLTVINKGIASVLSDVINCADESIGSIPVSDGLELWLDVNTSRPLNTLDIPAEDLVVNQVL